MTGPLRAETRELLKDVRPCAPFFSNMILAEQFENQNTRGHYTILPYATGGYLLFDRDAPNGQGVRGHFDKLSNAQAALREQTSEGDSAQSARQPVNGGPTSGLQSGCDDDRYLSPAEAPKSRRL